MAIMKLTTRTVLMALMLAGSASAMAAPHLTPKECNSYPFKPLKGEVTHKQLMRELSELEAQGYNPGVDDATYPSNLENAQQKLQAQYRMDCLPAQPVNSVQGNSVPGASTGLTPSNAAS
jgi:Spy/CpxP family protein refolding chaperone